MFKYAILVTLSAIIYFIFYVDIVLTNKMIGNIFVIGILSCLLVFLIFKFGLHYKIQALNRFSLSFYYSIFEYKKAQKKPSYLSFMDSVREQSEVALIANFDPAITAAALKIPVSMYSSKDPLIKNLRSKIQEAERIKLKARQLDTKADVLLGKTKDILVENEIVAKKSTSRLDEIFDIENGVAHIVNLTVDEIKEQGYNQTPDYDIITRIALDNNPYFSSTYKVFDSEDVSSVLSRAPFMIILLGIIGTFSGFYLALNAGGDIKSGAAVAIVSSLVGLPVSLFMDYVNTLYPDKSRYQQAFNKYKVSLEMLFNHEKELDALAKE